MRKIHLIFIKTSSFVESFWLSRCLNQNCLNLLSIPRYQTPENQHTRGPCLSLQIFLKMHSTSHYILKPGGGLEDTLCCCSTWGRTLAPVLAGQQAIQSLSRRILSLTNRMNSSGICSWERSSAPSEVRLQWRERLQHVLLWEWITMRSLGTTQQTIPLDLIILANPWTKITTV